MLRGCLLTGTSAALTVTVHSAAGGGVPDLGLFLVPTVLLAGAGTAVAERIRLRGVMIMVLGGMQLDVHLLLSMNAASHELLFAGHAVAGPLPMVLGHALATLLLGVMLSRLDTVLMAIVAAVSTALPARPFVLPGVGASRRVHRRRARERRDAAVAAGPTPPWSSERLLNPLHPTVLTGVRTQCHFVHPRAR